MIQLTAQELRERLQYDPNTGRWTWLKSPRSGWVGRPAGSLDAKGYWCIKIDGKSYKSSRLAHLYMTGEWPEEEMDHIDGKSWNDCWTNLRPATRYENNANRQMRVDNSSGVVGVFWNKTNNKWIAQLGKLYLGSFDTIEEATAARDRAAETLHGDFAVLNKRSAS
jgi:hypothetical protein